MNDLSILVVGGGIGGLTAAMALRARGHRVTVIERDRAWSVYGVGIIQQANVVRAMKQLGLVDEYLSAGVGFDKVVVHAPDGSKVAEVPAKRLAEDYPANVGVGRPALHKVLGDRTVAVGADVRLGLSVRTIEDDGEGVEVGFSDGAAERFHVVIGADGVYSKTRQWLFPDLPGPHFTGQAVWRYNLPRPPGMDALHVYNGSPGVGLVPISEQLMYMYVTTAEPGNPAYQREGLAAAMRSKIADAAPAIRELAQQITCDDEVVYRPLETLMLYGPWHKGRTVLLGDAVHSTTPHLGQGAGMAIEDSLVLAEELTTHTAVDAAFGAYRERRFERCRYIVERSLAICHGQLGKGPLVDNATATAEMFEVTAQPI
jgi:2-polyprenyl-6-methoxyphenol hydroxylase-like FAD-dependent oxidoreductase